MDTGIDIWIFESKQKKAFRKMFKRVIHVTLCNEM